MSVPGCEEWCDGFIVPSSCDCGANKSVAAQNGEPVPWIPGRNWSREEILKALADAAWEARMDGGCHSRTSEILTVWHKHLADSGAQDGERTEGWVWLSGHCGQHTFYPRPDFDEPEHHHGSATLIVHLPAE